MAPRLGAAAALALLLVPGLVAEGAPAGAVAWLWAPTQGPVDGEAVVVRVALEGPPGARWQVKAWLEGPGVRGVQATDGAAWQRADRYLAPWTLDAEGAARGWLAVRAAEAGPGPWSLRVRARDEDGRLVTEGAWPLAPPEGGPRRGVAPPGAVAVGAWRGGALLALAPAHPWAAQATPWDVPGAFALRAPADAGLLALDREGAVLGPVAPPPTGLGIAELLVDAAGDEAAEHVRLRNPTTAEVPLAGWALRGPGWEAVLAAGTLAPGATVAVAGNASAYAALTGRGDHAGDLRRAGMLRLPNAGGRVELWRGEALEDAVAWGDEPEGAGWRGPALPLQPSGLVHRRGPGPDTDRAGDFDAEPWRAGWEPRAPLRVEGDVVAFGREDALRVALAALASARSEVLVEVYLLTHPGLAAALHQALARGARVGVLIEGAPVGGRPAEEARLLDGLAAAGADVRRLGGSGQDRYATLHAKFAVLDGEAVLLGSENWTPSGFAADGAGNLGWGAWVRNADLAQELAGVWARDADLARGDASPWPRGASADDALPAAAPAPALPPAARANATLLLVPENARAHVLALLAGARASLDVASLQLPLTWDDRPSPVVEALRAAASRGVHVRVLLDGGPGGANAAAALEAWAQERGAPLEARVAGQARVHNKGIVVDGARALVGSANLAEAGLTWNREAALLLEGAPARSLAAAFEADWAAQAPGPADARADPALLAAPLVGLVLLAAARGRGPRR